MPLIVLLLVGYAISKQRVYTLAAFACVWPRNVFCYSFLFASCCQLLGVLRCFYPGHGTVHAEA